MGSAFYSPRIALVMAGLLLLAGLAGCSSTPSGSATHKGAAIAQSMAGSPYRYGGATPRGFDCSGLVYYAYRKAGISVPRTTREQYKYSERIGLSDIHRGDLLFFRLSTRGISHVGIYTGNGKFIHAPSSGKRVSYARLDNAYWKKRLLAAGRID
ncbi:MAG: C40 family peptidase [Gammaproteobacteria bacterium]|nr:MAG: C40 family peptidase [Gammaproteobacteria bacterium]